MKSITALIPPKKLSDVKDAILELGIELMTVTSVMACGPKSGASEKTPSMPNEDNFLNKTRIDIVVSDDCVKPAIEAIKLRSKNGSPGVGTLFVTDVPQLVIL
jgi:nitrogen regulatory protein PII